jgi:hypothetical protein
MGAARGPSPRFVVVVVVWSFRQLRREPPEAAANFIGAIFSFVVDEVRQLWSCRSCVEGRHLPGA